MLLLCINNTYSQAHGSIWLSMLAVCIHHPADATRYSGHHVAHHGHFLLLFLLLLLLISLLFIFPLICSEIIGTPRATDNGLCHSTAQVLEAPADTSSVTQEETNPEFKAAIAPFAAAIRIKANSLLRKVFPADSNCSSCSI